MQGRCGSGPAEYGGRMKRLAVFRIGSSDGNIDEYILYYLKELNKCVDHICIVYTGKKAYSQLQIISQYSDDITELVSQDDRTDELYRKYVIDHISCIVHCYDELVICDDSVFGPLYSLETVFQKMEDSSADFWGITCYRHASYELFCLHAYFIVIRRRMLHSEYFLQYWTQHLVEDAGFTDYFRKKGYVPSVYVDIRRYVMKQESNTDLTECMSFDLIAKCGMPFLRRKLFGNIDVHYDGTNDLRRCMEYIDDETEYDADLIWDNVIRTYNCYDLLQSLNLRYVLSSHFSVCSTSHKKTAVVMHVFYMDILEDMLKYLADIQDAVDIYITTQTREREAFVREKVAQMELMVAGIMKAPDRGRDYGSIYITCAQLFYKYDYICFVHDKKTTGGIGSYSIGNAFLYNVLENTIKNRNYVMNVLNLFENHLHLGVLSPPIPRHDPYLSSVATDAWGINYQNTVAQAERMGLDCLIERDKPPFALSNCFWCRTEALLPLVELNLREEDFREEPIKTDGEINHALERIGIYVAQSQGYYSGIVECEEYAGLELSNLYGIVRRADRTYTKLFSAAASGQIFLDSYIDFEEMIAYCKRHRCCYIYGGGKFGQHIAEYLANFDVEIEGYVSSDGYTQPECIAGKKSLMLSQFRKLKDTDLGLVVAVSVLYRKEVVGNLDACGINDKYVVEIRQ